MHRSNLETVFRTTKRLLSTSCARFVVTTLLLTTVSIAQADEQLLKTHCGKCHAGKNPKGDFRLQALGDNPSLDSVDLWETSLDYVKAEEMPPAKQNRMTDAERARLVTFLEERMRDYNGQSETSSRTRPRRLNNREFANSIRDALMIEDIGTNLPTDNLIGDALHEGFDTHSETLGFSKFHLEQFIEAVRKIVDATILSGDRPEAQRYEFDGEKIIAAHTSQNTNRPQRHGEAEGFDFLDPLQLAHFEGFENVPETGRYAITISCTGKDRGRYDSEETGVYDADPIRLSVLLGDRHKVFELPDEQIIEIKLNEWIAKGSQLKLQHPTDGLRQKGNGNFKFQNAITGSYLNEHDPKLYQQVVSGIQTKPGRRAKGPASWHHWVDHWMGPRPRVVSTVIEGPFYDSWPPTRQIALIGRDPSTENALAILRPIAERAWRREVR
ncbi:MAG: DUF1587 domain-containing protein, partial [Rubripirellula sp.]